MRDGYQGDLLGIRFCSVCLEKKAVNSAWKKLWGRLYAPAPRRHKPQSGIKNTYIIPCVNPPISSTHHERRTVSPLKLSHKKRVFTRVIRNVHRTGAPPIPGSGTGPELNTAASDSSGERAERSASVVSSTAGAIIVQCVVSFRFARQSEFCAEAELPVWMYLGVRSYSGF